jgi:hypothetical protein
MLLQLAKNSQVSTFSDLYTISLFLLQKAGDLKKTIVIGPVTSKDGNTREKNLEALSYHSDKLSGEGWAVLDLHSFQFAIDTLIKQLQITRYPHEILDEFTLPLIESRLFTAIHVLDSYHESLGATLEHDKALGCDVPLIYIL